MRFIHLAQAAFEQKFDIIKHTAYFLISNTLLDRHPLKLFRKTA
jgi:hypothetical protein